MSKAGYRFGFDFLDIIHPGGAGTGTQARSQAEQLIAGALGQNLHAAVGVVAHPARNAEDVRLALYKPAKTHTLNAAADQEAASLGGLLGRSHFNSDHLSS
jgi:hypothetical protein